MEHCSITEHSSINVILTYLRGLEIAELSEEDMPMIQLGLEFVRFSLESIYKLLLAKFI